MSPPHRPSASGICLDLAGLRKQLSAQDLGHCFIIAVLKHMVFACMVVKWLELMCVFFPLSPEVVLGYWERGNNEEQIALINNVFIVQSVG